MTELPNVSMLSVDANPHMRRILRTLLRGAGVRRFSEAGNEADAIGLVRDRSIDLALVEYELGETTGPAFAARIRNGHDSPDPGLLMILVTAHTDRRRAAEALEAGFQSIVAKPVSARALIRHVDAVLNGYAAQPDDLAIARR